MFHAAFSVHLDIIDLSVEIHTVLNSTVQSIGSDVIQYTCSLVTHI